MEAIQVNDIQLVTKSRTMAFLLSLFEPGFGQLYAGRIRRGLVAWTASLTIAGLLFGGAIGRSFSGCVVAVVLLVAIRFAAALDAGRLAAMEGHPGPWWQRWYTVLAFGLLLQIAVGLALPSVQVLKSYRIPTSTMEPTLQVGDHLVAALDAYERPLPSRNDVVIFQSPENPSSDLVKRIVAIPGDTVEIRDKVLYINGVQVSEPWAVHRDRRLGTTTEPLSALARRDQVSALVVPEGDVFVLGDNRDFSYDSRYFGTVPITSLKARPLYIYWSTTSGRMGTELSRP